MQNTTGKTIMPRNKVALFLLNFENFYKAKVIKTVWSCHKDRHIDK